MIFLYFNYIQSRSLIYILNSIFLLKNLVDEDNGIKSSGDIADELLEKHHIKLSPRTLRRYLNLIGLN